MTYIVYNSITQASRVKKQMNDKVYIEHAPQRLGLHSCAFAIKTDNEEMLYKIIKTSEELNINYDIFR